MEMNGNSNAMDLSSMTYKEFQKVTKGAIRDISSEVIRRNRASGQIKKEKTAVKNYEKIFDAVFKISAAKGFNGMSLRDLSRETGLSLGALYRYFSSKEELLEIMELHGQTMIQMVMTELPRAEDDPLKKLKGAIRAYIFLSEAAGEWFFFAFMESRSLKHESLRHVLAFDAFTDGVLAEILMQGEKEGIFVKRNHAMTVSIIKAMQQDWYLKRWKYSKMNISVDSYAKTVLKFVESYCVRPDAHLKSETRNQKGFYHGGTEAQRKRRE
jgi:TetR/AcrR family transcriptional regulator, cholesterol catabolism regulator